MNLFTRKDKKPLAPLLTDADLIDYNSVVEWLIGLSDGDYVKVGKVTTIHRKAYQDSAKILGTTNEPTTFINPPEEPESPDAPFLDHAPIVKTGKSKNDKA